MSKIDIKVGDIVKAYETWYMVQNINDSQLNVIDIYEDEYCCIDKENVTEIKIPCQYKTIYKREEPILDEVERRYLSAVIKPFRNKIKSIHKGRYGRHFEYEFIMIITIDKEENICFPNFKKGTMYKGMEIGKNYTLEELGL